MAAELGGPAISDCLWVLLSFSALLAPVRVDVELMWGEVCGSSPKKAARPRLVVTLESGDSSLGETTRHVTPRLFG